MGRGGGRKGGGEEVVIRTGTLEDDHSVSIVVHEDVNYGARRVVRVTATQKGEARAGPVAGGEVYVTVQYL